MSGRLYLVAVPIGNLADITLRAIETLKSVDAILAEDTRTSSRLLQRYEITTPFHSSIYQGAERQRLGEILTLLADGKNLALISDAGTPLISDPGFPLVRAVVEAGHEVIPIPGPSAALAALVGAGLSTDRFRFLGSLPRKEGERRSVLLELQHVSETTVAYESPHRLLSTLALMNEILPDRRLVLARELTKIHEEFVRGTPGEILSTLQERGGIKGECVLVLDAAPTDSKPMDDPAIDELLEIMRRGGVSRKTMQQILMHVHGLSRNEAYQRVHESDSDA